MGRYRSRSRSYSPRRSRASPPRRRFNDNRERSYRDNRSPASSGLLVRNISLDARPEDLRIPFERFGPVKDVYLPKDYHTREPRGFGFVKFRYAKDAAEAKHHLNHTVIGGREIAIVFAEENRKTPQEMRTNGRVSGHSGGSYRRRSPHRSPRHRYRSYSPSPSPPRHDSRDRDHGARDYYSPSRSRSVSRSLSPRDDGAYRSGRKLTSPRGDLRSPLDKMDPRSDRSPIAREDDRSPHDKRGHGFEQRLPSSRGDGQSSSRSRSPARSRSYSPR
uniref:Putative serine/arginine-rich SC35-like splicing factor SCL28 n=1 Tax=Davidia involucrata TaxID=16924 RepID=A0A5B6ZJ59_DAVIN